VIFALGGERASAVSLSNAKKIGMGFNHGLRVVKSETGDSVEGEKVSNHFVQRSKGEHVPRQLRPRQFGPRAKGMGRKKEEARAERGVWGSDPGQALGRRGDGGLVFFGGGLGHGDFGKKGRKNWGSLSKSGKGGGAR